MTLDLDAVRRRAEAATAGPWEHDDGPGTDLHFGTMRYQTIRDAGGRGFVAVASDDHATFRFIAHARTDVPALLDALEAAEAEVERLRAFVQHLADLPVADGQHYAPACGCAVHQAARFLRTEGGAS